MSNVNVKRLVENIRSGTNIYTPLVELVVNAIQAIDAKGIHGCPMPHERSSPASLKARLRQKVTMPRSRNVAAQVS
ncbi:hypothetical protein [Aminobacter aminovorans]|uniref:Uncharacterized protein n=1 Tax=Aminobacter aminovorans TaxID=83263 RepID=A0AAC9AQM4_AMIAI|nr:hypothetical protein [Aminobacter aminovorans]AMS40156.1 hypothetical protein AA2016_1221 [Aminobacter aminovorans]MBB3709883.1 hypothetical protein [Aminobacter aminovorans]